MKKQNTAALFLLSAMLLSTAVSCGSEQTDSPKKGTDAVSVPETEAETMFVPDHLPDDLDFGGRTFTMLVRDEMGGLIETFTADSENGEIVNDAIYGRNQAIEERLNVSLDFVKKHGEANAEGVELTNSFRASVLASDGAYDLAAVRSNEQPKLVLEGLTLDMKPLPYLDFSMPWWPDSLLKELTIDGKLYFASGDASMGILRDMICLFYNKDLADSYDIPDLYQTVFDGKWTFDTFLNTFKGVYADLDGDNAKSADDRFGYAFGDPNQIYAYIDAFQLNILNWADGLPSVYSFCEQKDIDVHDKLADMVFNNPDFALDNWNQRTYQTSFAAGNVLFINGQFKDTDMYRDIDAFSYGVLPMPKYDEAQKEYCTCVRATYSTFCIPATVAEPDVSAAVLECLASESYRRVTPAYFESALKVKYSQDNESARIYDLIRSSVRFSFGVVFTGVIGDPQNMYKETIWNNKNWMTYYASWEPTASKKLNDTIEKIKELE